MRKPIAVISSDCHLQPYTWAKYPTLCGDSYHSFRQIINYAVNNSLPLILAGDIIHVKRPEPKTVGFMLDQIARMEQHELPIFFIQGQHELQRERPWLCTQHWPTHVSKCSFIVGGVTFYGLDFMPADQLQEQLDLIYSDSDVLVAHQVWQEHMAMRINAEGAFADIPFVSTVITGDFHAHKITKFKGKNGQPLTIVSPGSTYMLALDEDNRKFFFVMYDDLTFESVPVTTREIYRIRIGSVEALEKFVTDRPGLATNNSTALPPELCSPIWHVEYYDYVPSVAARLEQIAKNKAHLFLRPVRVKDEAPLEGEESKQAIEVQPSLEDYLPYCLPTDDPNHALALRLLGASDVKEELRKIVDEVTEDPESELQDSLLEDAVQHG